MSEDKKIRVKLKNEANEVVKTVEMSMVDNNLQREAIRRAVDKVPSGNQTLLAMEAQHELFKMIILKVDDKILKGADKEKYDKFFDGRELDSLTQVIEQMMGKPLTPEIEFI